jgi:uncharacterized protein YggE
MRKQTLVFSVFLILAVILSACGVAAAQAPQQQPPVRTITVTGSGEVKVDPNIATIYIGVHSEDPDAKAAVASNASQTAQVIAALKAMGIDAKDIQTANYSVYPRQEMGPDNQVKPTVFVVDNTVNVTVRDLSKLGDILSKASDEGANNISGIQFDLSNKDAAMNDARSQAINQAKQIADAMAKAAGVTLGDIQSISTGGSAPSPIFMAKDALAQGAAASVPVAPGQINVAADVTIVFAIQ